MNGLLAAVAFLLATVVDGAGGLVTMTYSAQAPAPGDWIALGTRTVGAGFLAGYYCFRVTDVAGVTPDDDVVGYMTVTAP
jgi:hypothetical protein